MNKIHQQLSNIIAQNNTLPREKDECISIWLKFFSLILSKLNRFDRPDVWKKNGYAVNAAL